MSWTFFWQQRKQTACHPVIHRQRIQSLFQLGELHIPLHDPGFNKILDQNNTRALRTGKKQTINIPQKSSRNTARTSEALSKASLNRDTTILACIVRVISLNNQAYQRTDGTQCKTHKATFFMSKLYGNDDQVLGIKYKMFSNPTSFNLQRGFNQKMVPEHYKMSLASISCLSTCIYDAKSIIVSAPLQVQAS
jgi:hypothetical protein